MNPFIELVCICPISPFRLDQQSEPLELDPVGMAAPFELPDAELPDFELGENDIPGVSLEGLGDTWEKDHTIRARAVSSKSLLAWPSPKHVGVINFTTAKQNVLVLSHLLELWCPQVPCAKTVNIDQVRTEVGWRNQTLTLKCLAKQKHMIYSSITTCHSYGIETFPYLTGSLLESIPQVRTFRSKLGWEDDEIAVNCDSMSIRGFVTYLGKRHNGAARRDF